MPFGEYPFHFLGKHFPDEFGAEAAADTVDEEIADASADNELIDHVTKSSPLR